MVPITDLGRAWPRTARAPCRGTSLFRWWYSVPSTAARMHRWNGWATAALPTLWAGRVCRVCCEQRLRLAATAIERLVWTVAPSRSRCHCCLLPWWPEGSCGRVLPLPWSLCQNTYACAGGCNLSSMPHTHTSAIHDLPSAPCLQCHTQVQTTKILAAHSGSVAWPPPASPTSPRRAAPSERPWPSRVPTAGASPHSCPPPSPPAQRVPVVTFSSSMTPSFA
jgi:hypothetical protein